MEIQLHSTTQIATINGVPARIWEGHTASGIPVHAFITRIVVDKTEDNTQFEKELKSHAAPTVDYGGIPLRLLI